MLAQEFMRDIYRKKLYPHKGMWNMGFIEAEEGIL